MEISVFSAFQTNNVVLRYVKNSPILRNSLNPVEMVFPETRSTENLTCFGMGHQPGINDMQYFCHIPLENAAIQC